MVGDELDKRALRIAEMVSGNRQRFQDAIRQVIRQRRSIDWNSAPLIPIPADATSDEKLLVLAAIHDSYSGRKQLLDPWCELLSRLDEPTDDEPTDELTDELTTDESLLDILDGKLYHRFCARLAQIPEYQFCLIDQWIDELVMDWKAAAGDVIPDDKRQDDGSGPATEAKMTGGDDAQAAAKLLNIFTNGLADERYGKAARVLSDDKLTADEKLWKIDALMPFPSTVSAAKLGDALQVSKAAIQKTTWYIQMRKGKKDELIERRHEQHHQRGQQHESGRDDDDE